MTDETTTPEEETNTVYRYAMIGVDGVYNGLINGVSSLGYVVDAANHLPMVLNVLPGEQNFTTFHDRPFLGHDFIYDNLTGGMDLYKDTMGIVVPEPVTTSEHFAYGTGQAIGLATTVVAAGPIAGAAETALVGGETVAAVNAATKVSPLTSAFTAVTESPITRFAGDAVKWTGSLAGRFALSNPLITTGLVAGADVAYNDGNIVTPIAKSAVNAVTERMGIGTVFGNSADPNAAEPGIANLYGLANDPAKVGGMLAVIFGMNSILNNMLGNTLGLIVSTAIALVFHQAIGNATHTAVDAGRDMLDSVTRRDTPALAPAPGPR